MIVSQTGSCLRNLTVITLCKELSNNDYNKLQRIYNNSELVKHFSEEKNVAIFSAFLEFYGNRATSFVNLFVASIFGIVTLSAIIQFLNAGVPVLLSIIPYTIFSLAGYYTLERYFYYGNLAESVKSGCLENPNYYNLNNISLYDNSTKDSYDFSEYLKRNANKKSFLKKVLDTTRVFAIVYFFTLLLLAIVVYWNNATYIIQIV